MERLISSAPYAASGQEGSLQYNTTFVTKLLTNYRSHPCILRLPNALFYMNDLVVGADMSVTHGCVGKMGFKGLEGRGLERSNLKLAKLFATPRMRWGWLEACVLRGCAPAAACSFPIIFHHVVGKDEREGNSPSWFNIQEVALVGKYVNALLSMRANRLTPLDIGCITAYRKQVQRIRVVTSKSPEIKVGSVEEFQGQERRAIIMSTVRSSVEHLEFDTKHRLGFLTNPKRFNVAITRAKAMLVIIGNAEVLVNDPQWASLLEYVHRNGGWVGGAPPAAVLSASSAHGPAGTDIEDDWFRHLTRTSDVAAAVSAGGVGGVVAAGPAPGTAGVRNPKVPGTTNAPAADATSGAEGDAELAILEQLSRLSLSQLPATNLLQPTSNGAHPSAAWSNDARDDGVPVPETGTATPWGPTDWGFVGAVQVEGGEMPRWD
ncbi:hypothetical protein QJQ45_029893 [Haematococcus lacustris]|nr:hypothetical protein QJQ45_029893 [Haematococcus lacustris]